MITANLIIGILLIVMAVFLVISVLMQNGKDHRLSGSIAGGAETFFGKTKAKSANAILSKLTTIVTVVFVILVLVLYIIQPDSSITTNDMLETDGTENIVEVENEADAENEAQVESGAETDTSAEGENGVEAETGAEVEGETAEGTANTDAE